MILSFFYPYQEEYDSYLKMKELFTVRILEFMILVVTQVDALKTTQGLTFHLSPHCPPSSLSLFLSITLCLLAERLR